MRLHSALEVYGFREAISRAKGDVWLESPDGDKFNLKSVISQYIALGALLQAEGDNLELFCSEKSDEALFMKFFKENPDVL